MGASVWGASVWRASEWVQVNGCKCMGASAWLQVDGCKCVSASECVQVFGVQVYGCKCMGASVWGASVWNLMWLLLSNAALELRLRGAACTARRPCSARDPAHP